MGLFNSLSHMDGISQSRAYSESMNFLHGALPFVIRIILSIL